MPGVPVNGDRNSPGGPGNPFHRTLTCILGGVEPEKCEMLLRLPRPRENPNRTPSRWVSHPLARVQPDMKRDQMEPAQDSIAQRKQRGAFFTPPEITEFLTHWAIRSGKDVVLEPSCGEAAFLLPAVKRLKALGAKVRDISSQVVGVDIHDPSLNAAEELLKREGVNPSLIRESFFSLDPPGGLLPSHCSPADAVVGNPPFIRYQNFAGAERAMAKAAALRQGVNLTNLASSWAALLIHASAFLKPDGRLAMVVPGELLTVNYSEAIREFLLDRFASVHLIHFKRLVFKEALEDTLLLLAEGSGGCSALSFHLIENERELKNIDFARAEATEVGQLEKWTELLLPDQTRSLFHDLASEWFVPLEVYGKPELGTVTGANRFFALRSSQVAELGLKEPEITRISPPGTRHLRGLRFTTADWRQLEAADEPVWLLTLKGHLPKSHPVWALIRQGEKDGLHERYKCRIRDPWYALPPVTQPDLFFTYMNHRFPRLITNVARVGFLNSMHGLRVHQDKRLVKAALPSAALNSLTQVSAELAGRSYGGGILKLEPREAARLLVPRPDVLRRLDGFIGDGAATDLEKWMRGGDWQEAQQAIDIYIFKELMSLPDQDMDTLQTAVHLLRDKRLGRARA